MYPVSLRYSPPFSSHLSMFYSRRLENREIRQGSNKRERKKKKKKMGKYEKRGDYRLLPKNSDLAVELNVSVVIK